MQELDSFERYVFDGRLMVSDALDTLEELDGSEEVVTQMFYFFSTDALAAFVAWFVDTYADELPEYIHKHWSIRKCIEHAEKHCDGRDF